MLTSKSKNKYLGITVGDPCGIGPEITAKALSRAKIPSNWKVIVIGDKEIFNGYDFKKSFHISYLSLPTKVQWQLGKTNKQAGKASLKFLETGISLLKKGLLTSLVTAPLSKKSVAQSLPNFQGHTEFLAKNFKTKHVDMMFVAKTMRVVIATRHIPIKSLSRAIKTPRIFDCIQLTAKSLQKNFGIKKPRIAVCGLNPHAGEHGTMGKEETSKIIPAIQKARKQRINALGPFPADTLFSPKLNKSFDATIAMYHDQGLTPIKTLHFPKLVNLTIGLPFIRTSPAHGTAFDIAGKNKADPASMIEAIELAIKLSS